MASTLPLQFGIPGGPELLIILLIAVLLFGANKIPQLARSTGEAMGEFQKGREEVEQELQDMREGATGAPETAADEPEIETDDESEPEIETDDDDAVDSDDDTELDIDDAEADEETN
ncbi:twin-arginine translocase TatA/TatE family subunit [Natronomonas salsuginis]|jgi:sec-independent protein translocase protein TatA|uniref:Sec-independent protein translocase protein TatA n=1 Tax=Natronomonas salsuginis TaxID=2217661 RepID=A0A4U5JEG5_9EURY|nr:twin-arginine translocase TatA/TatE family subunit [Natronomonas salsuginis]TKR27830.1 twin-arginine translocase TatA/TatE family subunit [Natronomonas salsuginis]